MVAADLSTVVVGGRGWEARRSREGPWVWSRAYSTERELSPRAAVPVSVQWGRKRDADPPGSGHGPPAEGGRVWLSQCLCWEGKGTGRRQGTPSGELWWQAGRQLRAGSTCWVGCGAWASGLPILGSTAQALQREDRTPAPGDGIPDARSFASHGLGDLVSKNHVSTPVEKGRVMGRVAQLCQALPRSIHARTARSPRSCRHMWEIVAPGGTRSCSRAGPHSSIRVPGTYFLGGERGLGGLLTEEAAMEAGQEPVPGVQDRWSRGTFV